MEPGSGCVYKVEGLGYRHHEANDPAVVTWTTYIITCTKHHPAYMLLVDTINLCMSDKFVCYHAFSVHCASNTIHRAYGCVTRIIPRIITCKVQKKQRRRKAANHEDASSLMDLKRR